MACSVLGIRSPRKIIRERTILGRERQRRLRKTKTAITEINTVKLCRNCNLKDLLSKQLASYISESLRSSFTT